MRVAVPGSAEKLEVGASPPGDHGSAGASRLSEQALRLALAIVRIGPALLLVVLVVVLYLLKPIFLSETNIQNVLTQTSVIALLAMGQLLVVLTRGIDASVGSIVGLSTVIGATVYDSSFNAGAPVILSMLATGVVVGIVNGSVFVYGRLPNSLINTLGMLYILQGIAQVITHGNTLQGMPPAVVDLGSGFVGPIPYAAIVVAFVALVAWNFTTRTRWGRWIYAVGGNQQAAERIGIPVRRVLISVYVISGLIAGVAGVLVAGQTSAGYGLAGTGTELYSIAAVIIGGASFLGGRGGISTALVGAFIIGCLRNGLDLLNVYPTWQLIAIGSVMLLAVLLDVLRNHLEDRFRVLQAARGALR
jgi:ribose transport system permease protein